MFHQLSRVTGRLVATTHLQSPLYPIAVNAVQRVEVPIQYTTTHMSTVTEAACAAGGKQRLIPGTNIPYAPLSEEIRKKQKQFQTDDDVPVFLKGGPMDAVLYRISVALCVVGLVGILDLIYGLAVPKKN